VKGVTGERTTLGTTKAVKGSQTSGTIPQLLTIITSLSTLVEIMTSETVPVSSSNSTGTSFKTSPLTTTKPGVMTTYIIAII